MKTIRNKSLAWALSIAAALVVLVYAAAYARPPQSAAAPDGPRKITGNVYSIGTSASPSYLVVTPEGNFLINSGLEGNLPQLQKAIEQLGFKVPDIKIVLGTDARSEQREADALVKQRTRAQVMAIAEEVPVLQNVKPGGKAHPIDRTLHDGDQIALGGIILIPHLAPGGTPAATNWTLKAVDAGKMFDVVLMGPGKQPPYTVTASGAATPDPNVVQVAIGAMVVANMALVARGKDRYNAYACFDCHGKNGEGTEDAPDLVGSHLDAAGITAFLNKPSADAVSKGMPAIPPNSPDLQPLVAYVLSLQKKP